MEEKVSTKKQHQARLNPVGSPTDVVIQTTVGYNATTGKVTLNYSRNLNNVSFAAKEAVAFAQAIVRAAQAVDPECAKGATW